MPSGHPDDWSDEEWRTHMYTRSRPWRDSPAGALSSAVARLEEFASVAPTSQLTMDIRTLVSVAERAQEELDTQKTAEEWHNARAIRYGYREYHEKEARTAQLAQASLRRILGIEETK